MTKQEYSCTPNVVQVCDGIDLASFIVGRVLTYLETLNLPKEREVKSYVKDIIYDATVDSGLLSEPILREHYDEWLETVDYDWKIPDECLTDEALANKNA